MRYTSLCLSTVVAVAFPFVTTQTAFAAADTTPHQLVLNLNGHTRLKRSIDTDSLLNEGGNIRHAISHRDYNEVLTPTATGFTITRTLTKFDISPATAPDANINTPYWEARMLDMPTIVVTTSPDLLSRSIDNWPEIEARMVAAFPSNGSAQDRAAHQVILDSMTPAGAITVVDGQSSMLYMARKYASTVGQPKQESLTRQGPMGGGTLEFVTTYSLTRWDTAADTAELDFHSAPDNTSLSNYMRDTLVPKIIPPGTPQAQVDAVKADMRLTADTLCHFVARISTGLIERGECTINSTVHILTYEQSRKMTFVVTESIAP